MRPLPLAIGPVLAAILAVAPAAAEPAGSWVDPPARTPLAGPAGVPASPDAAMPDAGADGSATERGGALARASRPAAREAGRAGRAADAAPLSSSPAEAARRLVGAYLASISAENARTLAATPSFYGDRVRFHGRELTTAALIAQKRRYFQRWPERRYAALGDSLRAVCAPGGRTCTVNTLLGFRAASPARGARSQGVSELTLTVTFAAGRPVIASESSRVLRRGSAALDAAERGRSGA